MLRSKLRNIIIADFRPKFREKTSRRAAQSAKPIRPVWRNLPFTMHFVIQGS